MYTMIHIALIWIQSALVYHVILLAFLVLRTEYSGEITVDIMAVGVLGGRFKNTYELLNLRALKLSPVDKSHRFESPQVFLKRPPPRIARLSAGVTSTQCNVDILVLPGSQFWRTSIEKCWKMHTFLFFLRQI